MASPWYNPTLLVPGTQATAEQINAELSKIAAALDKLPAPTAIGAGGGQPNYTHRAYADSSDGTANFTTGEPGERAYLGLATNQTSATPSPYPADYEWVRIQGADAPLTILQFSEDGDGDWHVAFETGDRYWRQSVDGGETFTPAKLLTAPDLASLDPAAAAQLNQSANPPRMSVIAPITVKADYLGQPLPGQLPAAVAPRRYRGNLDVTESTNWTIFPSGGVAASIDNGANSAQRGVVTVTDLDVADASIRVVSSRDGVDIEQAFTVTRQDGVAPQQSGGGATQPGASASDTSFVAIGASTSFVSISDVLAVQAGPTGKAKASAQISFDVETGAAEDFAGCALIWRYSADGGSGFTDLGAEAPSSVSAFRWFSVEPPKGLRSQSGYVSAVAEKTGLAPGANAYLQLYGRRSAGTSTISGQTGSATVVPA